MQLYRCIQVNNLSLPINLYLIVVNNNFHIIFDGKTKRCTTFYKLKVLSHTLIFMFFVVLFLITYTTQVTHPLYESSELKTLTIQFTR